MIPQVDAKCRCCYVNTICGQSLRHGVVYVGVGTLIISSVILLLSIISAQLIFTSEKSLNAHPILAMNLIFSLVSSFFASYQILISALLLWQALGQGNIFVFSLWYISHLSMLTIYFVFFVVKVVLCFIQKMYLTACLSILIGILYEGVFIYFIIIVNSYLHSINQGGIQ